MRILGQCAAIELLPDYQLSDNNKALIIAAYENTPPGYDIGRVVKLGSKFESNNCPVDEGDIVGVKNFVGSAKITDKKTGKELSLLQPQHILFKITI